MATHTIYQLALITHLTGLTMVAGATLVDYILTRQFWRQHAIDKSNSLAIRSVLAKLQILFGIGFLLLIFSGVYMMYVTQGAYGEQVWFRIKFGLILLIIANGIFFGRKQASRLKKILSTSESDNDALLKIKSNLNRFHISQLMFFLTILTLSVFKFN